MEDLATIQLTFSEQPATLAAADLGEYLLLLSEVYNAAVKVTSDLSPELVFMQRDSLASLALGRVAQDAEDEYSEPNVQPLQCTRISYASPLEVMLAGGAGALALAVIVAGGEVKFFGATFKINKSLGAALQDLRAAIARGRHRKAPEDGLERPASLPARSAVKRPAGKKAVLKAARGRKGDA